MLTAAVQLKSLLVKNCGVHIIDFVQTVVLFYRANVE